MLKGTKTTRLVHLRGEPALIEMRLRDRKGHFFDPRLLVSQFEALEEPMRALVVDVDGDLETVTATVVSVLGLG